MASYTFLGEPPANVKEWIEKTYLTIYKVQTTSQYKKTGIYSAQRDDTSKLVVINWGDGSIKEVDGDISQEVHEYSSEGVFTVKVSNIKTFAASTHVDGRWSIGVSQNSYTLKELVNLNKAVTSIGEDAFWGCTSLTSVTIPDGVTSIGNGAFSGCSLTSVTIPDGVTSIGSSAFYDCRGLTSVTIPNSVTSIGYYAFRDCWGLTSVTIGNSVTRIDNYAFWNCSGLTRVTIPDSVMSIGLGAFSGCSGITSVTIGNGVTSIDNYAFQSCSGLTSVNITDIAKWCSISFQNNMANPLFYAHNLYLSGVKVTDLVIPDSVVIIGDYAFFNCSGLTSVTIPDSVMSIGGSTFYGCSGLMSVHITDLAKWCSSSFGKHFTNYNLYLNNEKITDLTIPDSVTSIGSSAFKGCSGLTSVTIPDSVTSIGSTAFYGCGGLASVTFDGTTVPAGNYSCFNKTSSLNDVYMMNIDVSMVQDQLNSNISNWELGVNGDGTYHTVTIHCMDGEVVIDPTPSGSSS